VLTSNQFVHGTSQPKQEVTATVSLDTSFLLMLLTCIIIKFQETVYNVLLELWQPPCEDILPVHKILYPIMFCNQHFRVRVPYNMSDKEKIVGVWGEMQDGIFVWVKGQMGGALMSKGVESVLMLFCTGGDIGNLVWDNSHDMGCEPIVVDHSPVILTYNITFKQPFQWITPSRTAHPT
jgi:hypothetical protein